MTVDKAGGASGRKMRHDRQRVGNTLRFCVWLDVECAWLPERMSMKEIADLGDAVITALSVDHSALRVFPGQVQRIVVKDANLNPLIELMVI